MVAISKEYQFKVNLKREKKQTETLVVIYFVNTKLTYKTGPNSEHRFQARHHRLHEFEEPPEQTDLRLHQHLLPPEGRDLLQGNVPIIIINNSYINLNITALRFSETGRYSTSGPGPSVSCTEISPPSASSLTPNNPFRCFLLASRISRTALSR